MDSILGIRISIAAITLGIVLFCAPQAKADKQHPSTLDYQMPAVSVEKN
ncbi:hypothetical protein V2H45_15375 [Tumidithrix elongata RA019]|uniref:Uncharacterized protein n=1 Tax=Tumidithrix elongata BACA0141 TaxID=2716417 RepID=A0AAW9Q3X9_9CYAN|nr:hypothetical protein [Tumidithrix elongata RA019]